MRTIHKFPLGIEDYWLIEVKKEAGTDIKVRHVGLDPEGRPHVWIELTPGNYIEQYVFSIIGTGQSVRGTRDYIGSFVLGRFVWHVYL